MSFYPVLPATGQYDVYAWWPAAAGNASNVPVDVTTATETRTVTVNQQQQGGQWVLLGTFTCNAVAVTSDSYTYDAFGGAINSSGSTTNPWQYGGQYGYYQDAPNRSYVRARHLHLETGRWMSKDPIGFRGQDANLYRFVWNAPQNWCDASGCQVAQPGPPGKYVVFIHGTASNPSAFTDAFQKRAKQLFGTTKSAVFEWNGAAVQTTIQEQADELGQFVEDLHERNPLDEIYLLGHSNGGNLAVYMLNHAGLQAHGVTQLWRFGSPPIGDIQISENVTVFDVYDVKDKVAHGLAQLMGAAEKLDPQQVKNWRFYPVDAPGGHDWLTGIRKHLNIHSEDVIDQIDAMWRLLWYNFRKPEMQDPRNLRNIPWQWQAVQKEEERIRSKRKRK